MTLERTKRERFLPYASERGGIACRLTRATLDGEREIEPNEARHLVALEDAEWSSLEIAGVLRVPAQTIAAVLPESEHAAPPVRALLLLTAKATRLRRAIRLDYSPTEMRFVFGIARADLSGVLELHPTLVRTEPGERPGFATRRGSRLATGRPWSLRIDRRRERSGRFLDTRYRRFSEAESLAPYADTLHRLELGEQPTLWLNADHASLQAALDSRGTRGAAARVREVAFDAIASSVWTQLFVSAALDLGEEQALVYDWQDAVLRELLPTLIDGQRTHDARLLVLRARLERGELPELLGRLVSVLQQRQSCAEHLSKLLADAGLRA